MRLQGDAGLAVEPEHREHHGVQVAQEPFCGHRPQRAAAARGQGPQHLAEVRVQPVERPLGDQPGDAERPFVRPEGLLAQHGVQTVRVAEAPEVDTDPGRVADDVEAGVRGAPLGAEAGLQQPVHLDAPEQFLAEVLPAGVGDPQPERELEHPRCAGPADRPDGRGRVPQLALRAQVVQPTGGEQLGHGGAQGEFAGLPGVQRQRGGAGWQQARLAEKLLGQLVGSGVHRRVGGEQCAVHGVPVQPEGAVQLGRVRHALRGSEAVPALRGRVQRVAEQQGLLGPQEGPVGRLGRAAAVGEHVRRPDHRVGHPRRQVGDPARVGPLGGGARDQGRHGDGVHRRTRPPVGAHQGHRAEAVPAAGRPVPDGYGELCGAAQHRDQQLSVGHGLGAGLAHPAAQHALHSGLFGGHGGVGVEQRVGRAGMVGLLRYGGRGSGEGGAHGCSLGRVACGTRQLRVTYP